MRDGEVPVLPAPGTGPSRPIRELETITARMTSAVPVRICGGARRPSGRSQAMSASAAAQRTAPASEVVAPREDRRRPARARGERDDRRHRPPRGDRERAEEREDADREQQHAVHERVRRPVERDEHVVEVRGSRSLPGRRDGRRRYGRWTFSAIEAAASTTTASAAKMPRACVLNRQRARGRSTGAMPRAIISKSGPKLGRGSSSRAQFQAMIAPEPGGEGKRPSQVQSPPPRGR